MFTNQSQNIKKPKNGNKTNPNDKFFTKQPKPENLSKCTWG